MTECSRRRAIHDWVAGVLGKADLHFEAASQDASFRRYLRVIDERCSYVIMDAPPERSDPHAFIDVQSRLRAAGLNVPQILAVDVQRGFFVLSDLGRARYLDVLNDSNADELYRASIDALVCMQTRVPDTDLPRYDESLLRTELALFDEWLLQRHLGIRLESDDRDALQTCFDFLVTSCLDQPQVFVHRDYHSRNLMVTERDRPGVLDFQDAVQGPIAYDLVSLLRDVYIAWPKERVEAWIGHYLVKMRAAHREIAVEQLHRWCDLSGAQRHIQNSGAVL